MVDRPLRQIIATCGRVTPSTLLNWLRTMVVGAPKRFFRVAVA
jgi:hypothetical protein